mmetsp:Transcript_3009/g.8429  ORF Transcript_3009/g.8429 Transcript_3009/m.8429 type:complete len:302 (+) Transcript_3009:367-1272(+)
MTAEDHKQRWLFTSDQIRSAPSIRESFTYDHEQSARKFSAKFIADIGQSLRHRASILAINCAKVFLHRYFMSECVDLQDKQQHKVIAITCLFVACKSEECLRPLKEFVWAWNFLEFDSKSRDGVFGRFSGEDPNRKPWEIDENCDLFKDCCGWILTQEERLLCTLQFDFTVDYPHSSIPRCVRFFERVKREKETRSLLIGSEGADNFSEFGNTIIGTAQAMVNDTMSTVACIQYAAWMIAAACTCLSLRMQGFKVQSVDKWRKLWNEECGAEQDVRMRGCGLGKDEFEGWPLIGVRSSTVF